MPLVYDRKAGHTVHLSDDQVEAAIASGQYAFRAGARIPVMNNEGKVGTISAEDAPQAFSSEFGYRWFGQKQREAHYEQERANIYENAFGGVGMGAGAALLGAARGLSFGLSDVAIRAMYGEDATDALRELQNVQGMASLGGELGSILLGGASAAGGGLRLAARAGRAAESATARRLLGSQAVPEIAKKAAALGAGSVVEGSLYAAGQLVSEGALGDPQLNAQHIATTMGLDALMSAGMGALPVAGAAGWRKLRQLMKSDVDEVAKAEKLGLSSKAIGMVGKLTQMTRSFASEADAKAFQEIVGPMNAAARSRVFHAMDNPEMLTAEFQRGVDGLLGEAAEAVREWGGSRGLLNDRLKGMPVQPKSPIAESFLDVLNDMDRAVETMRKSPYDYPQRYADKVAAWRDEALDKVFILNKKNELVPRAGTTSGQIRETMLDLKQRLTGDLDLFKADKRAESQRATLLLRGKGKGGSGVFRSMQDYLRREDLWGDIGASWARHDDAYAYFKSALKDFSRDFTRPAMARDVGLPTMSDRTLRPTAFETLLRNPDKVRSKEMQEGIANLADSIKALREANELNPSALANIERLEQSLAKIQEVRGTVLLLNNLESMTGKSLHGLVVGGALGAMGGLPGAIAGATVGAAIANPKTALRYLWRVEQGQQAGANLVKAATAAFVHRTQEAAEKAAKAVDAGYKMTDEVRGRLRQATMLGIAEAAEALSGGLYAPEAEPVPNIGHRRTQEVLKLQDSVNSLLMDPSVIDNRLRDVSPMVDASVPEVYAGMTRNVRRAAEFLAMKLPQLQSFGGVVPEHSRVSTGEYLKLQRYVSAALRPQNLLAELSNGKVRRETVEAVQYVYPELFSQVQTYLMQFASTNDRMSYEQKTQMGILFGVPTTSALGDLPARQLTATMNEIERQQAEQKMRQAPAKIAQVLADQNRTTSERIAR